VAAFDTDDVGRVRPVRTLSPQSLGDELVARARERPGAAHVDVVASLSRLVAFGRRETTFLDAADVRTLLAGDHRAVVPGAREAPTGVLQLVCLGRDAVLGARPARCARARVLIW
jgi:hypothetical protein